MQQTSYQGVFNEYLASSQGVLYEITRPWCIVEQTKVCGIILVDLWKFYPYVLDVVFVLYRWNRPLLFRWPMDANKYFWYISGDFLFYFIIIGVPGHMLIIVFPFIFDMFFESRSKLIRCTGMCANLLTYEPGTWEMKVLAHDQFCLFLGWRSSSTASNCNFSCCREIWV